MVTSQQIELVQSSFQQVSPIAEVAGEMLYERIFVLAPETRALFDDNIRPQARRLMNAVAAAVNNLADLDTLAPMLVKLGARHVRYGVRPEHFDIGGSALIWTLEKGLRDAFTPEVRESWEAAWNVVADAMLTGMRQGQLVNG